jgi:hypothetical protein
MATRAAVRRVEPGSEEWAAAHGLLVAVTAATGGMLSAFAVVAGEPPLAAVPALLVAVGGRVHLRDSVRGGAGAGIWFLVAPHAHAEALVAPLLMAVAWITVAIGPERLWSWIRAEWAGRDVPPPHVDAGAADAAAVAWIEDDLSVR